jgi:hypothetical protein
MLNAVTSLCITVVFDTLRPNLLIVYLELNYGILHASSNKCIL